MSRQPAVIAYDIRADRTRRRVCQILLEWRLDGQKSVHECTLSVSEAQELFIQLGQAIDPATDHLLLAWITPRRPMRVRGVGRMDTLFAKLLNVR